MTSIVNQDTIFFIMLLVALIIAIMGCPIAYTTNNKTKPPKQKTEQYGEKKIYDKRGDNDEKWYKLFRYR